MAKKLDNFDPTNEEVLQAGRPPEYPWHLWLGGGTWEIKQGTEEEVKTGKADFSCQISSMISLIRHTMAMYEIKVSIFRKDDGVTLILKPRTEDGEEKE